MAKNEIPYKIYLNESEMPKFWYNLRADMKNKPAPLLNPGTHQPMTAEELGGVFCDELVQQELDNDPLRWSVPTAWRRSWAPPRRSTTSLRATIPAAATS